MRYLIILFTLVLCLGNGCVGNGNKNAQTQTTPKHHYETPVFNADSAYHYVDTQVAFGPRVPNTKEHEACASYLAEKLKSFGAEVIVQEGEVTAFDDTKLSIKNIIGQFNPDRKNRLLFFAHWDTRPYADHDKDPKNHNTPIDGANDGASGVGVLLEIARLIGQNPHHLGIDIIFFDAEDYGTPDHLDVPYKNDTWCLGTQYWGQNLHVKDYYARWGILLDMVGAPNATFYKEMNSKKFAPELVNRVWNTAGRLGYGSYFYFGEGGMITDDHVYVNKYTNIPCIDIIQFDPTSNSSFGSYWHTMDDTMDNVSKKTLKAVGQTLLEVIYTEQ